MTPEDFIKTNATLIAPPLVPEIKLYLASEVVPLWHATEEELSRIGVPPYQTNFVNEVALVALDQ